MESLGTPKVTFEALRTRLVKEVNLRIHNGEFTERGLARILGISQSQAHNVLKGARMLQMRLADRILLKLGISAMDLLLESELHSALRLRDAVWGGRIAEDAAFFEDNELDLAELLGTRKPAARSDVRTDRKNGRKAC